MLTEHPSPSADRLIVTQNSMGRFWDRGLYMPKNSHCLYMTDMQNKLST